MDEEKKKELIEKHGVAAAYGIAVNESMFEQQLAGANESVLRDLAERMTIALKSAKLGKAEYWHRGATERIYVNTASGKKAGFVEMLDGKCFFRENVNDAYLSIFRAARKAQKEQV